MEYEVLIAFAFATLALASTPGPDNLFVLTLSISGGWRQGLAVVAGLMTGCLVHTTLLAFGLAEIIKRSDALFWLIKLFGAAYLVFLAVKTYQQPAGIVTTEQERRHSDLWGLYKKGLWMNILNPKVAIFFLAFFPGFMFNQEWGPILQFYVLGGLFILVSSLVFGGVALAAGNISKYLGGTPKAGLFFKWLQISVFLSIALYVVLS